MFHTGQWVRWSYEGSLKEGQVVETEGVSFIVEWLDGDRQVFPVFEYVTGIEVIGKPPKASSIKRDAAKGRMSIARAASVLGTTPKRVRAKLREGALQGVRKDGKWVSVDIEP